MKLCSHTKSSDLVTYNFVILTNIGYIILCHKARPNLLEKESASGL